MNAVNKPPILSIRELVTISTYVIPLYQRNYAWTTTEINQLLQDIWDKAKTSGAGDYYIGTFITRNRGNETFELVDGQQRHTTLTLVHSLIRDRQYTIQPNLVFDARDNVQRVLLSLFGVGYMVTNGMKTLLSTTS